MDRDFAIDPEMESYLPKLTTEEWEGLRKLIISNEHVDPLVVLFVRSENVRILGDGHNRLGICDGEGISYTTRTIEVADRPAAIQWLIDNQLGRRNLTDERKRYYRGKEYLLQKRDAGRPPTAKQAENNVDTKSTLGRTAEEIGKKHGVNEKTVRRDAEFAEAVDAIAATEGTEAKEKILSGQSGQSRKEVVNKADILSKLCDRCRRLGKATCDDCRSKTTTPIVPPEPKPTPNGAVVFDWRAFNAAFGTIIRQVTSLARSKGMIDARGAVVGDEGYKQIQNRLGIVLEDIKAWYTTQTGKQVPS